jgi:flagellar motor component MotA
MPATLIGLVIAAVGTFVGGILHNVSPVFLLTNITALLVVLVGAGGATMASFELPATIGVIKTIIVTLFPKSGTPPAETISQLVTFARKARQLDQMHPVGRRQAVRKRPPDVARGGQSRDQDDVRAGADHLDRQSI